MDEHSVQLQGSSECLLASLVQVVDQMRCGCAQAMEESSCQEAEKETLSTEPDRAGTSGVNLTADAADSSRHSSCGSRASLGADKAGRCSSHSSSASGDGLTRSQRRSLYQNDSLEDKL